MVATAGYVAVPLLQSGMPVENPCFRAEQGNGYDTLEPALSKGVGAVATADDTSSDRSWTHRHRWALVVLLVILLALTIVGLVRFGTLLFWGPLLLILGTRIANATGCNIWLSWMIMFVVAIPGPYLVGLMFSMDARKRRLSTKLCLLGAAAWCGIMFTVTQDDYFATDGTPIKWYAETPWGIIVRERPGIDPETGYPLKPMTPEVATRLREAPSPVEVSESTMFFDPSTGKPIKWYCKVRDKYRIFNAPGLDSVYGKELEPVTPEVVEDILRGKAAIKKPISPAPSAVTPPPAASSEKPAQQAKPAPKPTPSSRATHRPSSKPTPEKPKGVRCPACGTLNGPNAAYCHECGRKL